MLGLDRRNSMFAALYLTRSDTNLTVNHVAFQVWKSLIPNTPKVRACRRPRFPRTGRRSALAALGWPPRLPPSLPNYVPHEPAVKSRALSVRQGVRRQSLCDGRGCAKS